MVAKFKMYTKSDRQQTHLMLVGHFDGSAAYELLITLKKMMRANKQIVVHTDNLAKIHPFGGEVFNRKSFELNPHSHRIKFIGEDVRDFLPDQWDGVKKNA